MGYPTEITDYTQKFLKLLSVGHWEDSDIYGFLDKTNTAYEELEAVLFDVLTETWLDSASGQQLGQLGTILGIKRAGRDDETYRTLLRFKAEINTSNGEPEILIKTVKLLYNASNVQYNPDYPAAAEVLHDGTSGLFIAEDLILLGSEENLTTQDGENFQILGEDAVATELLDLVIPAGVSVTVGSIP